VTLNRYIAYVADCVLSNIDSVLEDALSTGLAGGGCTSGSDNLVGSGLDVVLGVEVEEVLVLLPVVVLPLVLPVLFAVLVILLLVVVLLGLRLGLVVVCGSSYGDGSAEDSEGCGGGEMHDELLFVVK
jgi:hypothetical protein